MNPPAITQALSPLTFPVGDHVLHRGEVHLIKRTTPGAHLGMTEYDLEPTPRHDGPVRCLGSMPWKKRL